MKYWRELRYVSKMRETLEEIWGLKWALQENAPTINHVSWNSRTNRISIKWVNHNGWIDIAVIKKNYFFLFIFSTNLIVFLLKFWLGELVGCGIWFYIQRVPTLHTFDGPPYPKNKKYMKKHDDDIIITFFQVFLVFGVAGSIKSMQCGYSLDAESNSASNELSRSKFE